jgi:hypothetical protein
MDQPPTVWRASEPQDPQSDDNPPPGCILIETQVHRQEVPGTSLWVGEIARVLQTPTGELVTQELKKGVRCGCGHRVFSLEETVTENGIQYGIGGTCHYCSADAQDLLRHHKISLQEAEENSLYCTQCSASCADCNRRNLCSRHANSFTDINKKKRPLCPECQAKAKRDKFFRKTGDAISWLLGEDDGVSPPRGGRYYDY